MCFEVLTIRSLIQIHYHQKSLRYLHYKYQFSLVFKMVYKTLFLCLGFYCHSLYLYMFCVCQHKFIILHSCLFDRYRKKKSISQKYINTAFYIYLLKCLPLLFFISLCGFKLLANVLSFYPKGPPLAFL